MSNHRRLRRKRTDLPLSSPVSALLVGSVLLCTAACESTDRQQGKAEREPAASESPRPSAKPLATAEATATAEAITTATAEATSAATGSEPSTSASATQPVDVNDKGVPLIPQTTSDVPTLQQWETGLDVNTQGPNSRPPDCYMKVVREWLKVHCDGEITKITDKENLGKLGHDYFEAVTIGKAADFVMRIKPKGTMKLRIWRQKDMASLFMNWPPDKDRPLHIALGICVPGMPCWDAH